MSKAVGAHRRAGRPQELPADETLGESATRVEALGHAQAEARTAIGDGDYARALDRLFAAIARLNPLQAAAEIRKLERDRARREIG